MLKEVRVFYEFSPIKIGNEETLVHLFTLCKPVKNFGKILLKGQK